MKHFALEKKFYNQGYDVVIGCDEVGRGSLAGPVVAAAVYFDPPQKLPKWWKHVADSKTLSATNREEIAEGIRESATGWGMGWVGHGEIDRINIHQASLMAMGNAVGQLINQLSTARPILLIDGKFTINDKTIKLRSLEQRAIIKGDSLVHSIAAASILAKVHRDSLMRDMHLLYPEYGFDAHKGYATVRHRTALQLHGLSAVHRATFCGKIV